MKTTHLKKIKAVLKQIKQLKMPTVLLIQGKGTKAGAHDVPVNRYLSFHVLIVRHRVLIFQEP